MRRKLFLSIAVASALVVAACGDDDDDDGASDTTAAAGTTAASGGGTCEGDALKVGFAADFGELGAFSDTPASEALQFEVDRLNTAGGVDGTPVELTVKNIAGSPETTQAAAQELIDAGMSVILGPPFSDTGFPLLTQIDGKIPVIFVASTEAALADAARGAFIAAFSDPVQASAAAEYALAKGAKNSIVFSSPDAPYFEDNPSSFINRFEAGGGKNLQNYTFSLADQDFSTQVNEIASLDPKPDVLFTAMIMPQIGTLLGQLRGAGVELLVIGADAFDATGVVAAGADAEGVVYAAHTFPEAGGALETFLADFEAGTGAALETISFGALAYDALHLAIDACQRAGSTDAAAIAAALKETEGFTGLTGDITYKGTNGIPVKPVFMIEVKGGAPTLAEKLTPTEVAQP